MLYPVGTRVRLVEEVDIFPHGILPAGATGTVIARRGAEGDIRFDTHFDFLDEWDNVLFIYPEEDYTNWTSVEPI
jgi:hypothetical protein